VDVSAKRERREIVNSVECSSSSEVKRGRCSSGKHPTALWDLARGRKRRKVEEEEGEAAQMRRHSHGHLLKS